MNSLSPGAVEHLWPVAQLLGLTVAVISSVIVGFRWLRSEVREIASELVVPVTMRLDQIEKEVEHIRELVDEHHRLIGRANDRSDD